jgi:hypothetical protein
MGPIFLFCVQNLFSLFEFISVMLYVPCAFLVSVYVWRPCGLLELFKESGSMWVSLMARVQAGWLRDHGLIPGSELSKQNLQFVRPPPIKCVLWALSSGPIWECMKLTSRLQIVLNLRMRGSLPHLPCMPSCCAQGQLNLSLYLYFC